jgi:hypothetical protein
VEAYSHSLLWNLALIRRKVLVVRNAIIALVLTVVGSVVVSGAAPEPVPTTGATAKKEWVKASKGHVCMTHPAQLDPCFEGVFDGVRYRVAYSDQTKRVSYLYTSDTKFRTADGLQVGGEISVTGQNVRALPGWEIWAPTTSDGWRPIIGFNAEVKLKDGTLLKLSGKHDGSKAGTATIQGFSRGRL